MKTRVLIYAMITVFFISCKERDSQNETMSLSKPAYGAMADSAAVEAADEAVPTAQAASIRYTDSKNYLVNPVEKEAPIETKIIKSGDLRFQTDDMEATYNQITDAVKKHKASIKNDNQFNDESQTSKTITIRIPNENFDTFINDIAKGVSYFDQKQISSQDVTEEYIDVASRIKTEKVLEERYLELLKKANKVSEMLEIEGQLSEIREEIEAKEGRLKYLENKVSMSTLNIEFYKPKAHGGRATVSYGGRIGNAIISGFNGISNFFINLLGIWPLIVTLVVLFVLIRKRFKRKNKNEISEN